MALVRIAGMGFGLLVTVVMGRYLGAEGLGIYGYCVILLSLLAVPVSNGWATLTLRAASRAMHDQQWQHAKGLMQRGAQLSVLLAVFAFVLGLLVYGVFAQSGSEFLSVTVLGLLAFVLCFDQLSALRLAVLRGLQHPVWGQAPEMLVRPLLIVVFFLLIASMVYFAGTAGGLSFHELLITLFLFLTAPVSAHMIAKVHILRNKEKRKTLPETGSAAEWATLSGADVRKTVEAKP